MANLSYADSLATNYDTAGSAADAQADNDRLKALADEQAKAWAAAEAQAAERDAALQQAQAPSRAKILQSIRLLVLRLGT